MLKHILNLIFHALHKINMQNTAIDNISLSITHTEISVQEKNKHVNNAVLILL